MEIYKNSYSVNEDETLWEIHEIRHKLHEEQKNIPLAERNKAAMDLLASWRNGFLPPLRSFSQDYIDDITGSDILKLGDSEQIRKSWK